MFLIYGLFGGPIQKEGLAPMLVVSACLAGVNCKFDGGNNLDHRIRDLVAKGMAVPVCPEQLGGNSTPREAVELNGVSGDDVLLGKGSLISESGKDKKESFVRGAEEVLKIAQMAGAKYAILKERSPSCGSTMIYDGSFTGQKRPGRGVTTALLEHNGIRVYSEEELDLLLRELE